MPPWVLQPFRDFLAYSEKVVQLLHISMSGIALLRQLPQLAEALLALDRHEASYDASKAEDVAEGTRRLNNAQEEAKLARQEVEAQFPLLHAQALIVLWGAFESLVSTLLANWI